jgi:hypothetical protein
MRPRAERGEVLNMSLLDDKYGAIISDTPLGAEEEQDPDFSLENKYADIMADPRKEEEERIRKNLEHAYDADPNEEAEVQELSELSGVGNETARNLKPELDKEKKIQELDIPNLQRRAPVTAKKISEPDFAMVGSDDIRTLEGIEWLLAAIPKAWQQGQEQVELADIGLRQLSGGEGFLDDVTEEDLRRAKELEERQSTWLGDESWVEGGLVEAVRLLPQMLEMGENALTFGIPVGTANAGLALLAGQAGPQAGVLEELVTVPTAFLAGFIPAAKYGASWTAFKLEAGLAYRELDHLTDAQGKGMDETTKRVAAVGIGTINAALETFSVAKGVKWAGGDKILDAVNRKSIKEVMKKPTVKKAFGELGRRYALTHITEVSTEIAQESTNIILTELAKEFSGQDFEGVTLDEVGERLTGIAVKTAQAMMFLGAPGVSANFAHDLHQVKKSKQNQAIFQALGDISKDSTLHKRIPKKLEEAIAEMKERGDISEIGIPAEEFIKYFQENTEFQLDSPDAFDLFSKLNIEKNTVQEAIERGGDILIPLEKFVAHIAPSEHLAGLMPDLRMHPGDLTQREASAIEADLKERMDRLQERDDVDQERMAELDKQEQAVKNQFKQALIDAGTAPQVAEQQAQVHAAMLRTAAENTPGADILSLMQDRELRVEGTFGTGKPDQAVPFAESQAREGVRETVTTAAGTQIETQFEVIEADDLVTSDQETFDQNLQPRERGARKSSEAQIDDIARNLNPAMLGSSAEADRGAPIISPDNMVESGNGRVLALRQVYAANPEQAKAYREFLESQGVDVSGFKNPVLVRKRLSEMDMEQRRSFVVEANVSTTATMSTAEQAQADQDVLTPDVLSLYRPVPLTSVGNAEFIRAFLSKIPQSRMNEFVGKEGRLSGPGVLKIQGALLGKAFGGTENSGALLAKMLEETSEEQNVKSIVNAMIDIAAIYGRLKDEMAAGNISQDFDITESLVTAVNIVSEARASRQNINEVIGQGDMFTQDPLVDPIIKMFYEVKEDGSLGRAKGKDKIAGSLLHYINSVSMMRQDQQSLIPTDDVTPESIIADSYDKEASITENLSLFQPPADPTNVFGQPVVDEGRMFETIDMFADAIDQEVGAGGANGDFTFQAESSPLYENRTAEQVGVVSDKKADQALQSDATSRKMLAKGIIVKMGQLVGARLNINVLKNTGVPTVTVHKATNKEGYKKGKGFFRGEVLTYQATVSLKNAYMNVDQKGREKIASGQGSKFPMASVDGEFNATNQHNYDGVEFRFNPHREHLFIDKFGRALKFAEEVTIYGDHVFARGKIEYYKPDEIPDRAGGAKTAARLFDPSTPESSLTETFFQGENFLEDQTDEFAPGKPVNLYLLPESEQKKIKKEFYKSQEGQTEEDLYGTQIGEEEKDGKMIPIMSGGKALEAQEAFAVIGDLIDKHLGENGRNKGTKRGVWFANPGIKGIVRAREKVVGDYEGKLNEETGVVENTAKGGWDQIKDVVRGGFVAETPGQAEMVANVLKEHFPVLDEGWNTQVSGYFDRKLILRLPNGVISEVQIWEPNMLEAKDGLDFRGAKGHKLYEVWRHDDTPKEEKERLNQEMYDLYFIETRPKMDKDWQNLMFASQSNEGSSGKELYIARIASSLTDLASTAIFAGLNGLQADSPSRSITPSDAESMTTGISSQRPQRGKDVADISITSESNVTDSSTINKFGQPIPDLDPESPEANPAFQEWSEGAEYIADPAEHTFQPGEPVVVSVIHGTTHDFDTVDTSLGNLENDLGKGFYTTSNPRDAEVNYGPGGPDLLNRLATETARIHGEIYENPQAYREELKSIGLDADDMKASILGDLGNAFEAVDNTSEQVQELAEKMAYEKLVGDFEQGTTMDLYVKMQNPFIIHGHRLLPMDPREGEVQTVLDFTREETPDDGSLGDYSPLADAALEYLIDELGMNPDDLPPAIFDLFESGPITASNFLVEIRQEFGDQKNERGEDIGGDIASGIIRAMGFDGVIYQDASGYFNISNMEEGTKHFVVYEPNQVKSQENQGTFDREDPNIYAQPTQEQPGNRGSIEFSQDRTKALITLLEKADETTFLHEIGHYALEFQKFLAENFDNPQAKEDFQAIQEWLDRNAEDIVTWLKDKRNVTVTAEQVRSQIAAGDYATGPIAEGIHEYWARGWERYMAEGKAPSIKLKRAFASFTQWFRRVYKQMVDQNLNVNMDEEIRGVMDRLLATEFEIEEARGFNGATALFADAEAAGVTPAEWAKYQRMASDAAQADYQKLYAKLIKEVTRQRKAWWKEEKAKVQKEVEEEVNSRPVFQAHHYLTQGGKFLNDDKPEGWQPGRLSGQALKDIYGEDWYKIVPKFIYQKEGGYHPDVLALVFGFQTGDEMIQALKEKEDNKINRKQVIKEEVDRIMKERHGDIMSDGSIKEEAKLALMNETRGDLLAMELRYLERLVAREVQLSKRRDRKTLAETRKLQRAVDTKTARAAAKEIISKKTHRDLQPAQYERAARRLGKQVEQLVAARDFEGAATAKRQQLLNHFLYIEAKAAREEFSKARIYAQKFNKKSIGDKIAGDYLEQIFGILEKFEFRQLSLKEIDKRKNLGEWIREQWAENNPVNLDNRVIQDAFRKNYRELTLEELRGVVESIKNLESLGRRKQQYILNGERRRFEEVRDEFIEQINTLSDVKPASLEKFASENRRTMLWDMWEQTIGEMTKPSFIAQFIDQGKPGIAFNILIKPFMVAEKQYYKLMKELGKPIFDILTEMPRQDQKRLQTVVTVNVPGKVKSFKIADIYSIALNMGNQSNLEKLKKGHGWNDDHLLELTSHLTKEDWQRIQQIWDGLDTIKPLLFNLAQKIQGVKPVSIEPQSFTNQYGDVMRGGYYPVIYDTKKADNINVLAKKEKAETEMWGGNNFFRPDATVGSMYERTAFEGPLLFDLMNLSNHVNEILYQVAHYEAVENYYKMMRDKNVAKAFQEKLGRQHYLDMVSLAVDVSNNGHNEGPGTWVNTVMQHLRHGTTLYALGYKLSTAAIQPSGLIVSAVRNPGPKWITKGIAAAFKEYKKDGGKFVMEHSNIMENRIQQYDREVNLQLKALQGKAGLVNDFQRFAFYHIGWTQLYVVDMPTWMGAYLKEMEDTGDHDLAVSQADLAVEQTQGSGAVRDMAKLMRRGGEAARSLTMFQTFFSAQFGQIRGMTREAKASGDWVKTAAALVTMLTATTAYEALLRGKEPDDDEDWTWWYLKQNMLFGAQSLPVIRDLAGIFLTDFDYQMSPVANFGKQLRKAADDAGQDDGMTLNTVEGGVAAAGTAFHLPVGQFWNSFEHLYDVSEGDRDFTVRELLFGNQYQPK